MAVSLIDDAPADALNRIAEALAESVEVSAADVSFSDGVLSASLSLAEEVEAAEEFDISVPAALRIKALFAEAAGSEANQALLNGQALAAYDLYAF